MKNLVRDGFRGMVLFGIGFLACALSTLNFSHGDRAFAASKMITTEPALRTLAAPTVPASSNRPPRAYAQTYFQIVDETVPPGCMAFAIYFVISQNNGAFNTFSSSTVITVDMTHPKQQVETALRQGIAEFINSLLVDEGHGEIVYSADDIFGLSL